jgi:hypothetical protein
MDFAHGPSADGKSTGAKAAKPIISDEQVMRSANVVVRMIAEGRYAEGCSFLYWMHKYHIAEWVAVRRQLIRAAGDQRSLQTIATLLEASERSTLGESAAIIPGLTSLLESQIRH